MRLTVPITEALSHRGFVVRVALGPAHGARDEAVLELDGFDEVTLTDPEDYVAELATCGLAVLGAGSGLWESSCLGTPAIAVVVADNQRQSALAAHHLGVIRGLHDPASDSLTALSDELVRVAASPLPGTRNTSVDGLGAKRVAGRLLRLDLAWS